MSNAARPRLRFGVLGAARIAPDVLIDPAMRALTSTSSRLQHGTRSARRCSLRRMASVRCPIRMRRCLNATISTQSMCRCLPRCGSSGRRTHSSVGCTSWRRSRSPWTPVRPAMVDQAEARGLVLAEGFHYVFHPMFARALELLDEGVVGEIEHLEVQFDGAVPSGPEAAIYLDPTLGGGVLLHQACYALHAIRSLAALNPMWFAPPPRSATPVSTKRSTPSSSSPQGQRPGLGRRWRTARSCSCRRRCEAHEPS